MKIVHGDKIAENSESAHRGGRSNRTRLLEGEKLGESNQGNFSLVIARPQGRYSPRHKHNFEQFRFQLVGTANYSTTGKLKPGMLGYFPEGTLYGPQTQDEGQELAVLGLQCGGASGSGYPGRDAEAAGTVELQKHGEFKDGIFIRNEGEPGKRKLDAFQAIWEHLNSRPLVYPKPRYASPVLMNPDHYQWVPIKDQPGVAERLLGIFNECGTGASMFKINSGADFTAKGGRDIYFVNSGTGTVENEPYNFSTTVYLKKDEQVTFSATEETVILNFHLPNVSEMQSQNPTGDSLQAAE